MRFPTLSALALVATVVLPSCNSLFHPRQGMDPNGGQQPSANPYGTVPQSNPYATPAANTYGQPAANPYSQAPAAPSNPYSQAPSNPYSGGGGYEQPQTYPSAPSSPYSGHPTSGGGFTGGASSGSEVTVQSGDNLTKIARRNNTTISALKSANGLTSDMIRVGQKLRIP